MKRNGWKKLAAAVALLLILAGGLYMAIGRKSTAPERPRVPSSAPVVMQDQSLRLRLTNEFICWFELQYISGMRRVAGSTTDVDDLVKEVGLDRTVERYADLRRVNLDYVLKHPDCRVIPEADLDGIGQAQYDHVVKNARGSTKWLDYGKDKLRSGVIESYKMGARVWIPFYQRLLNGPPPPPNTDVKAFIKATFTKDEYLRLMDQIAKSTIIFHAALKEGVSRYAPWSPWVKSMIDKSCVQDNAVSRATADEIYGK